MTLSLIEELKQYEPLPWAAFRRQSVAKRMKNLTFECRARIEHLESELSKAQALRPEPSDEALLQAITKNVPSGIGTGVTAQKAQILLAIRALYK